MADIRASFFIECEELLEALQDGLQSMEDGAPDDETVNVVFRAVHSIKGGAGAFGLEALVGFAHIFETALDELRNDRLALGGEVLKTFFRGADVLSDLVRASRDGLSHDPASSDAVRAALEALTATVPGSDKAAPFMFEPAAIALDFDLDGDVSGVPPPAEQTYRIRFRPEPALYAHGNEPLYLFRALRDLGQISTTCHDTDLPGLEALAPEHSHLGWEITLTTAEGEAAIREVFDFVEGLCRLEIGTDLAEPASVPTPDTDDASPAIVPDPPKAAMPAPADTLAKPAMPAPRATVRVDLERIDRLVNLVGEIVINQAMLSQSVEAAGLAPNSPVRTGLEEFLQLTRDIQDSVMMIRAQPVKSLFQRMSRIVREASTAIGKEVRLTTDGENTEIDKTVIERLADPLTHMIRNAVDHGLERNDDRVAAGKPRDGTVFLTAMHRSGRVVIEVGDDGAGIDRDKVLAKAIDRGLAEPGAQLSESDIDNLLFLPGFSTADTVSNLSGRGVGMDVVRSAIQGLGGRIAISSEPGRGTTFSISLPLTLAVLDGMVIKVAGETLVVPLNAIHETMAISREALRAFGSASHVINIRDTFVPVLDLGVELGYRDPLEDYLGGVVLLIGQDDGSVAALVVDSIEDQRQVVIKGLEDSYGRVPGIAAATILGDGRIALILDPAELVANARGLTRRRANVATPALPTAMTGTNA